MYFSYTFVLFFMYFLCTYPKTGREDGREQLKNRITSAAIAGLQQDLPAWSQGCGCYTLTPSER